MLLEASFPSHYWVDAIFTAAYIINRLPSPTLKGFSPYQKLFHRVPDYSFMRVFGSACYPNFSATSANKLSPRSVQFVFLGYAPGYKGYRCLDPTTGRVYLSRHVRFHEDTYPFKTIRQPIPSLSPNRPSPMALTNTSPTPSAPTSLVPQPSAAGQLHSFPSSPPSFLHSTARTPSLSHPLSSSSPSPSACSTPTSLTVSPTPSVSESDNRTTTPNSYSQPNSSHTETSPPSSASIAPRWSSISIQCKPVPKQEFSNLNPFLISVQLLFLRIPLVLPRLINI
ncbi:unnamed protein product [Cuscuta europaea]|uniref:Retroviral polymerase SH3-like domain-containing protein n=1 Tax=Cuscuta europaea TaxID=41803 RepID=A0A9P0VN16_CUSEU|nr:unnamed protein product [Cuscuta europaea]